MQNASPECRQNQPETRSQNDPALQSFQSTAKVTKRSRAPRQQIAVACLPCQKRRCRCDGTRPVCNTCIRRGKDCEWNVEQGLSRVAHLKKSNKELEEDSKDLKAVIELLRNGSDSDAAAVLARLRVGHDIASIVQGSSAVTPNPNTRPIQRSTNSELNINGSVPDQLRSSRPIDRQDWGRLPQRSRGVIPFLHQQPFYGSQPQSRSQFPSSATRLPPAVGMPAAAPVIVPQTFSHMTANHDGNGHQLVQLRNFGNMDFSSGIWANGYPRDVQQRQVSNLFTPQWAKLTVPETAPEGHAFKEMNEFLLKTLMEHRQMLEKGATLDEIAGPHPRLAAIMDDKEFEKAPSLTQWACRMVYSIKETNRLFVCYASIYLFWWIMRWLIAPCPETYFAIPEFLRPSPTQLFMPHPLALEFLAWPGLRDHLVQTPHKAGQGDWALDMSLGIGCACPLEQSEMMKPSPVDGELELSPKALQYASNVECWSVTPSFRQYFLNADQWMRIRWD